MGLDNLDVMIPFPRTVDEAKKVIATMAEYGLKQGDNGLKVMGMCEIPSNVILVPFFHPGFTLIFCDSSFRITDPFTTTSLSK